MDNDDDQFDLYEKIKEFFKMNPKVFDLDFLIFTDPDENSEDRRARTKPVKIHYHFEPGMDKPDVSVEGNIDKKELNDYFKRFDFPFNAQLKKMQNSKKERSFDARQLSLEPRLVESSPQVIEPHSEINESSECVDLVFEAPGVDKDDIILSFSDDGLSMNFSAETRNRKFFKHVHLPRACKFENYDLEINNGLVILRVNKRN